MLVVGYLQYKSFIDPYLRKILDFSDMNSVSPGYYSTKPLYILLKLTRTYRNSTEIGGLAGDKNSLPSVLNTSFPKFLHTGFRM